MASTDYVPNTVEPSSDLVAGGDSFTVTVTVHPCLSTDPAASSQDINVTLSYAVVGGGTVPLSSPPTSVTIASGQTSGSTSSIGTTTVGAETVVRITATRTTTNCGTVTATADVTIQP